MNATSSTSNNLDDAKVGDPVLVISERGDKRVIDEVAATTLKTVTLKNAGKFSRRGKEWGHSSDYYYGSSAYVIFDMAKVQETIKRCEEERTLKIARNELEAAFSRKLRVLSQADVDTIRIILDGVVAPKYY